METLLDNLIKATGWSILHSIWQGALIYGLLLPSQMRIFKVRAKYKYVLAYTANCFMLASFLLTFVSLFHWPSNQDTIQSYNHEIAGISFHPPTLTISQYAEMAFPFVALFYTFGLFIQSYVVFKGYKKVEQLRNETHFSIPEEWQILFMNLTKKLNIKKHITFHLSPHVTVPLVLGYLKPIILFPMSLALQMDIKQVEAILIHELSHVRRNDYLLNLVKTIIETILFFNPFVWLISKFINIEREHACDDLVISLTNTPLTYAHALLQLELLADKTTPSLTLAATGSNQHLYQRIKRITDMKTNYMNSKQKLFAITLTIATIVSLAWINPSKSERQLKVIQLKENDKIALTDAEASPADTTKKKFKKIVRKKVKTSKSGKVISIVIDTITGDPSLLAINNSIHPNTNLNFETSSDSLLTHELINQAKELSINTNKLVWNTNPNISAKELNKIRIAIQKNGQQLQKKFNSPEYRAKMLKFSKELQAKYNTPEERAKLKAFAAEAIAKANSPEQRLKWQALIKAQNYGGVTDFTQNTPTNKELELIEKLSATQNDLKFSLIPTESLKKDLKEMEINEGNLSKSELDQINLVINNNALFLNQNNDKIKIQQTPEYIQLKKKFDKDVQELVNKKTKKSN